jgi:hypothetical protein
MVSSQKIMRGWLTPPVLHTLGAQIEFPFKVKSKLSVALPREAALPPLLLVGKEDLMAEEELLLLRLVKAFVKIKDERRHLEIIELIEAAAEEHPERE